MRTKDGGNKISVDSFAGLGKCASLQNRRNFLRILGEQRRKPARGEERSFPRARRASCASLCSPKIRKKSTLLLQATRGLAVQQPRSQGLILPPLLAPVGGKMREPGSEVGRSIFESAWLLFLFN